MHCWWRTRGIIVLLALFSASAAAVETSAVEGGLESFMGSPTLEFSHLFTGDRFPTVAVAMDGTILAFWNGVVVRRSEDGGRTWGPEIDVGAGFMGGGVTVDEGNGDILAFVEAGHPPAALTVYRSQDHGVTWQQQETVIHGNDAGHVPAMHMNEHGITLRHGAHAGRLIRPSRWYGEGNGRKYWPTHYTNAVYSDDGGRTWQASEPFPLMGTGEACIVELSDGILYYNSRRHWAANSDEARNRWAARSDDGGATWTDMAEVTTLPDGNRDTTYGLMGGLVRLPVLGRDILVFSNIISEDGRKNGVVWASFDGGDTWPVKRVVEPGPFAYSSLNAGRPGTPGEGWIYLLYETDGHPDSTGRMARFNLAWLLEGEATGNGELPEWLPVAAQASPSEPVETVRVMTFNLWVGGEAGGLPLSQSAAVIRAAEADIVGIQEGAGDRRFQGCRGWVRPDNAAALAKTLGWHHADQGNGRAVISRHPILKTTPERFGSVIALPSGQPLHVFNIHFPASPYQPYQLLRIPYEDAPFLDTAEELVAAAESARGGPLSALLAELNPVVEAGGAVILTGDFNEPSHLDWTPAAVEAGLAPMAVPYPTTTRIYEADLRDAYRAVHPDPITAPGWTWTPITTEDDPEDRHDRIDMIFTGPGIDVLGASVIGERDDRADIVVQPYPSDHRAVVADLAIH